MLNSRDAFENAILEGHIETAKLILKTAKDFDATDVLVNDNLAVRKLILHYPKIVKMLIDRGADLYRINKRNSNVFSGIDDQTTLKILISEIYNLNNPGHFCDKDIEKESVEFSEVYLPCEHKTHALRINNTEYSCLGIVNPTKSSPPKEVIVNQVQYRCPICDEVAKGKSILTKTNKEALKSRLQQLI